LLNIHLVVSISGKYEKQPSLDFRRRVFGNTSVGAA
jgi:hypothetical protein